MTVKREETAEDGKTRRRRTKRRARRRGEEHACIRSSGEARPNAGARERERRTYRMTLLREHEEEEGENKTGRK
jgi:hypothetical protein